MDALGSLEEIAEQASFRINEHSHRGKFGWGVSPNIARASVVREAKPASPKIRSVAAPKESTPTVHIFPATEVTCYSELINALKEQVGLMGVRYEDFDTLVDWAAGLTGKVFGPSQVKRLGPEKLFDAVRAAGLRLRVEIDPEQEAKMKARISQNYNPRQSNQARRDNHWRSQCPPGEKMIDRVLSYLANRKGGLARLNKAVKQARSNWARQAAKALWGKKREGVTGDFAAYLGNVSRISDAPALRPSEERGSVTNPCGAEANAT
jgi:hypothetical protein